MIGKYTHFTHNDLFIGLCVYAPAGGGARGGRGGRNACDDIAACAAAQLIWLHVPGRDVLYFFAVPAKNHNIISVSIAVILNTFDFSLTDWSGPATTEGFCSLGLGFGDGSVFVVTLIEI